MVNPETGVLEQEGSCYLARGHPDPQVANIYLPLPEFDSLRHFA